MKRPKTPATIRPRHYEIPPGYVDAIGLDDEDIPVTPFVVGSVSEAAPQGDAFTKAETAAADRIGLPPPGALKRR